MKTILIVDDDALMAHDIQKQVEALGYGVVGVAGTGGEAVALAHKHLPSAILMDICLRGAIDGVQAAVAISRSARVPIIFLTSYSTLESVQRATAASPYGYLTKPLQKDALRVALAVALQRAEVDRISFEGEQLMWATLAALADAVIATELDGRIRFLNAAAEAMFGHASSEARDKPLGDVLKLSDGGGGALEVTSLIDRHVGAEGLRGQLYAVTRDGSRCPVDVSVTQIRDSKQVPIGIAVVVQDARERLSQEAMLNARLLHFRKTFEFAPIGTSLVALNGNFLQVNDALCRLLGYPAAHLLNKPIAALVHEEDVAAAKWQFERLEQGTPAIQFENRFRHGATGRLFWVLVTVSLLREGTTRECYLYQLVDVTEKKAFEDQLTRAALFDQLTGLGSRVRLHGQLEQAVTTGHRERHEVAVVYLDLDNFARVNETFGHALGDEVLREVSTRLRRSLRASDAAARQDGDEFVMVLPKAGNLNALVRVIEKLHSCVVAPIAVGGSSVVVTPSLGVAVFPEDGEDADALLRCAGRALGRAKARGGNGFAFDRPEMTQQASDRQLLEHRLRRALERQEFVLEFQPVVRLRDGGVDSFEALLRWNSESGVMAPGNFIRVVEETGLMPAIGDWVLREACQYAASWSDVPSVSVNCSAWQLRNAQFTDAVESAARSAGLPLSNLRLEVGETILLKADLAQLGRLRHLRNLGVHITVDDYGQDHTSIQRLASYSARSLKVDSSLVSNLTRDPCSVPVVSAAISMAHALGIEVVGKCVETAEQMELLRGCGCELGQGFFFGRPKAPAILGNATGPVCWKRPSTALRET